MESPDFDYQSATTWLFDRINYEKVGSQSYGRNNFRLARMQKLLAALGNPHRKFPIVHIAGTKGKGSVAWLVAESLRHNGQRVGLYTSPHLIKLEERFVVDGKICTADDFVDCINQIFPFAQSLKKSGDGQATFFEVTTAIGFLLFAKKQVDVAVVEVGLGGRLDSTNVCSPAVCVLTSISFDHMQQLGNTIALIAAEKAGIIKPTVPVVSGVRNLEATAVIAKIAAERGSRLRQIGVDFQAHSLPGDSNRFELKHDIKLWPGMTDHPSYEVQMLGEHQVQNAATAIATLEVLSQQSRLPIADAAIRSALRETQVAARMQRVGQRPDVVLDSAHNVASISALLQTLDRHWPRPNLVNLRRPRVIVFAASSDKDYASLIEMMLPRCEHLILTQYYNNPRAVPFRELANAASGVEQALVADALRKSVTQPLGNVHVWGSPAEAFRAAKKLAGEEGLVCITGSFFLAAELLTILNGNSPR